MGGAGRAAGYDVAKFAVRADCGPSYCGAGPAAGSDFQPAQGLNIYNLLFKYTVSFLPTKYGLSRVGLHNHY